MTKIKFISDNVSCNWGEWTVELDGEQAQTVTELIDTETLIAELKTRGYSVSKDD
jgi:hypothetical protein